MFTRTLVLAGGTLLIASTAQAQNRYVFSVNWHGPTVGAIDPTGIAITEGDLLYPSSGTANPAIGALPTPTIAFNHVTVLGLPSICVGHLGGTPCIVEVDAFSRGNDRPFVPNTPIAPGDLLFSVDEFATGFAFGAGAGPSPNVSSEYLSREAASDAFTNLINLPPGPFAPFSGRNIGVIDGDGLPSASGFAYPGVGLIEPNTPFGGLPDTGDNKDALDLVEPSSPTSAEYFSLDSGFLDVLESVPNTSSALANGFVGGDILVAAAGAPAIYAPANALGLDLVGGPDSDDLDALILVENGNGVYDPVLGPYSWTGGGTDMVVFSVRRGSAVIGMPDSLLGIPIMEGDLLIPPVPGSALPGIFIPAEALGLATLRSGTANTSDDLNAADSLFTNVNDCDGDGVEDAVAIAFGSAADTNMNGIPDSCEGCPSVGVMFCFCPTAFAPCGNVDAAAGCLNVAGTGALLSGCGSSSVSADDLVLTTSGMTPGTFALTFMGSGVIFPAAIGNGILCLAGPLFRFPPYATGSGTGSIGPGLAAYTLANNPPVGHITAGSTWNFQTYYRDIGGPCGSFFNLSSALGVVFTP